MIPCLAVSVLAAPAFLPPRPWALGFSDASHISLVGDVDHDGYADLISIKPKDDCIIDVNLSVHGWKAAGGAQAQTNWGKDCQAAAIGEIDQNPGADVVGIFGGKTLRLAGGFKDGHFIDTPAWVTLPRVLSNPGLSMLDNGKIVLVYSRRGGDAFEVGSGSKNVTPCRVPAGMVWIGDEGDKLVGKRANGDLFWIDPKTLSLGDKLGAEGKGSTPAAGKGMVVFGGKVWTANGTVELAPSGLPACDAVEGLGPADAAGDLGIFDFRLGTEPHTGEDVLFRRPHSSAPDDSDDSDAYNTNLAGDGLLDGWKLHGFRGLDLKSLGCKPGQADVICLISRFEKVNEPRFKAEIDRVIKFYLDLPTKNPDGTTGIHFHPIFLPVVSGDDEKNPWQVNRDKFRPEKWRGVVHWMQVTPGGGGQADELGDGGTCGEGALWAVFVHEFGHQLCLDHSGFWPNDHCPLYTSLMNYPYSYSFEDSRDKIHYSDGHFSGFVLRETDLDETLPFPYEKVKFLEKGPYHFHLKANGDTTLIDWNWNGIFGEKHIRADINYAYSTTAGNRDDAGRTKTAPWLVVHSSRAYVLFGINQKPADAKTDPSLSPDNPGRLMIRPLIEPYKWAPPITIESGGLTGDPVAASFGGQLVTVYPTELGIMMRRIRTGSKDDLTMSSPVSIADDRTLVPTVGVYAGRLYVFLWNPQNEAVAYRIMTSDGKLGEPQILDCTSQNPVGLCTDTITGEAILGLAQDQGSGKTNRWQVRRYRADDAGKLVPTGWKDWVEGEKGGSRGSGRITVLFDSSRDAGPQGRIYFFCSGLRSKSAPWACSYVGMQIADKSTNGGWLVKRYYDEWTQSRSAPAVAWFNHDMIFAYRWVDGGQGSTDNILHVAYGGMGIQSQPMGDSDDIGLIRNFGMQNCLLNLGKG
ncbi:MAG TPA: hypothetical protein VG944_22325 [Fimbriimonas sp.]|nr:hypothetical protein [Fimbriimonas sp.]